MARNPVVCVASSRPGFDSMESRKSESHGDGAKIDLISAALSITQKVEGALLSTLQGKI